MPAPVTEEDKARLRADVDGWTDVVLTSVQLAATYRREGKSKEQTAANMTDQVMRAAQLLGSRNGLSAAQWLASALGTAVTLLSEGVVSDGDLLP